MWWLSDSLWVHSDFSFFVGNAFTNTLVLAKLCLHALPLLIPFDRWHPTSASTVDGERPLAWSLNLGIQEWLRSYALPRDCQPLVDLLQWINPIVTLKGFLALALISLFFCPQCCGADIKTSVSL